MFHEWRCRRSCGVPIQPRDDNGSSSEDEESEAPVPAATTSGALKSATAAAASTSHDCGEVCLVAPCAGFAHWCRVGMRVSVKRVLCACQIHWCTQREDRVRGSNPPLNLQNFFELCVYCPSFAPMPFKS